MTTPAMSLNPVTAAVSGGAPLGGHAASPVTAGLLTPGAAQVDLRGPMRKTLVWMQKRLQEEGKTAEQIYEALKKALVAIWNMLVNIVRWMGAKFEAWTSKARAQAQGGGNAARDGGEAERSAALDKPAADKPSAQEEAAENAAAEQPGSQMNLVEKRPSEGERSVEGEHSVEDVASQAELTFADRNELTPDSFPDIEDIQQADLPQGEAMVDELLERVPATVQVPVEAAAQSGDVVVDPAVVSGFVTEKVRDVTDHLIQAGRPDLMALIDPGKAPQWAVASLEDFDKVRLLHEKQIHARREMMEKFVADVVTQTNQSPEATRAMLDASTGPCLQDPEGRYAQLSQEIKKLTINQEAVNSAMAGILKSHSKILPPEIVRRYEGILSGAEPQAAPDEPTPQTDHDQLDNDQEILRNEQESGDARLQNGLLMDNNPNMMQTPVDAQAVLPDAASAPVRHPAQVNPAGDGAAPSAPSAQDSPLSRSATPFQAYPQRVRVADRAAHSYDRADRSMTQRG